MHFELLDGLVAWVLLFVAESSPEILIGVTTALITAITALIVAVTKLIIVLKGSDPEEPTKKPGKEPKKKR